MLPLIILGGFMTNSGNVPSWVGWLQYISPVRYGFEAMLQNEFSFRPQVLPENNPVVYLHFTFGYAGAMFLMLAVAIVLRFFSVIILKMRVTRFQ